MNFGCPGAFNVSWHGNGLRGFVPRRNGYESFGECTAGWSGGWRTMAIKRRRAGADDGHHHRRQPQTVSRWMFFSSWCHLDKRFLFDERILLLFDEFLCRLRPLLLDVQLGPIRTSRVYLCGRRMVDPVACSFHLQLIPSPLAVDP